MAARRTSGELESQVLAALWAGGAPRTTGEVADALGGDLAYTTVQTILTRLLAKGAVRRQRSGRAHAYTPVLDEAGLAAHRMHAVLEHSRNSANSATRAAVLSSFAAGLRAADAALLADLLRARAGGP